MCRVDGCDKPIVARQLCLSHYKRLSRHGGELLGGVTRGAPLAWLKDKTGFCGDECLIWPFGYNGNGYGRIRYGGKSQYAHRVMCVLVNGEPSHGMQARHLCGSGHLGCVNPKHLAWGTPAQNENDKREHGTFRRVSGEAHCRSKLKQEDIDAIRVLAPYTTQAVIAGMFGVSAPHVSDIVNFKTWKGDL